MSKFERMGEVSMVVENRFKGGGIFLVAKATKMPTNDWQDNWQNICAIFYSKIVKFGLRRCP